jgi:sec-independent protein translocase protein TatB
MPTPFNVNGWEFIVIVVFFMLLFGPEKLPEIALQAGKLLRDLREAAETATGELRREIEAAAEENREVTSELRDFGDSARRILQDKSKVVREGVRGQLKDLDRAMTEEGRSIAPTDSRTADVISAPSETESVIPDGGDEDGV